MAFFDLPLAELRDYRSEHAAPADLESFWRATLAETAEHPLDARFSEIENHLALVTTFDVEFSGFGGDRIRGWLHVPTGTTEPLPTVVHYHGYSGGRGLPHEWLDWVLAGYAHFAMDTRGQGWSTRADTVDAGAAGTPGVPGKLTDGIHDPAAHYYRRVYADAVRAIEAARSHPLVDADRVVTAGGSQGGGLALAAASLVGLAGGAPLAGVVADVPFLSAFRRAVAVTESDPYAELVRYLARYRDREQQVYRTLSYFDVANLVPFATAPALFSVALMDRVCPPSTVFAAFNAYGGDDATIEVYPYNGHEGGGPEHDLVKYRWVAELFGRSR